MSSFPIGSSVLLQNLVKGAHLNDKKGIVKSRPNAATGRQEVYVFEAQKSMAVRPANLRYEPRELSSLSVSEMKGVLSHSKMGRDPSELSGMDKDELRAMVAAEVDADDPAGIAARVAEANEPKGDPRPDVAAADDSVGPRASSEQLRQGAERMSQMSPDDIRRQAATMKAMGPAALRACTPQMAGMTDAQINMAIAQMEAVANNPSQLKMAADQMKNMSDGELRRAVDQSPLTSQTRQSTAAFSSNNSTTTPRSAAAPTINNVSKSQFQQATQHMSSMSPDQLRQQAAMLKSMPLDTLRKSNPQMANMTDAQIQMSMTQLEQMAENPDMIKLAADQMKNMTEDQYESMKKMMGGGGGGTATNAAIPDPSKMMEQLLSDPDQLNSAVKMMKQNPEMLKSVMASQLGVGDDDGDDASAAAKRKQMEKAIDSFAELDDAKLERYLKVANAAQSVARPVWNAFDKAKRTLGVSTMTLVIMLNLMVLASFVLLTRWWKMRGGGGGVQMENGILAYEDSPPEMIDASHYEREF